MRRHDGTDITASDKRVEELFNIPLCFLGLGLWRTWITLQTEQLGGGLSFASLPFSDCLDSILTVILVLMAINARKLVPLCSRPRALVICGVSALISTLLEALMVQNPALESILVIPALLACGLASALFILFWCEIYSCLTPFRVAFYYSLSFIVGALLSYIFGGLTGIHLIVCLIALPPVTLVFIRRSYRLVPKADRPKPTWGKLAFPWKLVALLAVLQFAYGLRAEQVSTGIGSLALIGDLAIGIMLFVYTFFFAKRFSLSVIYRTPVVLLVCVLLLIPFAGGNTQDMIAAACITVSFKMFEAVIFLLLCDYSKRFGVAAVFIFGIEEATVLFHVLGNRTAQLLGESGATLPSSDTTLTLIVVALVIIASLLLLSEHELSTRWGCSFMGPGRLQETSSEQARISLLCNEISKRYAFTSREDEVFQLLAHGKSTQEIESELFIAEGTVKAHTRHIYEKLGIHTRKELNDLLAISEHEEEE